VNTTALALIAAVLITTPALAHGDEAAFGRFGGFGFGGHGRGFGDFGGVGDLSFGFLNVDRVQERYEDRLDAVQTKYDDGVANTEDFFASSTYDRIVNRTESLTDSYGLFLSGVERGIHRLTDIIGIANDDLTYYNDLLATYQADDTLSADQLARIERYITRVTDRLDMRIDSLTEQQTTLQTNLPTYQSFQTEISDFLTTITAAGTGTDTSTTDTSTSVKLLATMAMAVSPSEVASTCEAGSGTGTTSAVPEPGTAALALLAVASMLVVGRRQRRS
jgi:hypothetical protein